MPNVTLNYLRMNTFTYKGFLANFKLKFHVLFGQKPAKPTELFEITIKTIFDKYQTNPS